MLQACFFFLLMNGLSLPPQFNILHFRLKVYNSSVSFYSFLQKEREKNTQNVAEMRQYTEHFSKISKLFLAHSIWTNEVEGVPPVCRDGFHPMTSGSAAACTLILVEQPSFTGTCASTQSLKLHSRGHQSEATTLPKVCLKQSVTKMSYCFWAVIPTSVCQSHFFMLQCHDNDFPKIVQIVSGA